MSTAASTAVSMAVPIAATTAAAIAASIAASVAASVERASNTNMQLAGGDFVLLLVSCRQDALNIYSIGSGFPESS